MVRGSTRIDIATSQTALCWTKLARAWRLPSRKVWQILDALDLRLTHYLCSQCTQGEGNEGVDDAIETRQGAHRMNEMFITIHGLSVKQAAQALSDLTGHDVQEYLSSDRHPQSGMINEVRDWQLVPAPSGQAKFDVIVRVTFD
jgi:hypothetical protein